MIKVVAANVVMDVLDRAIQVHGSLGMSDDTPLAGMWRFSRMLKVADGPDEVHKMVIARRELNRWAKRAEDDGTTANGAARPRGRSHSPPCREVDRVAAALRRVEPVARRSATGLALARAQASRSASSAASASARRLRELLASPPRPRRTGRRA